MYVGLVCILWNTFLFLTFHKNHNIQGKQLELPCSFMWGCILQYRKSKFVNTEVVGKQYGVNLITSSLQRGWAFKKDMVNDLMVSSDVPHSWKILSHLIPRWFNYEVTANEPKEICLRKCFRFGGILTFHAWTFRVLQLGPQSTTSDRSCASQ